MCWRSEINLRVVVLTALLLSSACSATAGTVKVPNGFVTGNMYRQLSDAEKQFYAMGLVDGIFGAPMFGARPDGKIYQLSECVAKMNSEQVAAILSRELLEHPEIWHRPMNQTGVNALVGACQLKE
jgi:hypothetical protein